MRNKIAQGDIIMANHLDKFQKWARHPFIVIGFYKNFALGLQFTSVKKASGKAIGYFDKMTLETMYQTNGLYNETKSFDKLWDDFFKAEQKYETIDLDDEDGFEYWSRANLNDLYLFNLDDALIYDFDIKNVVQKETFNTIIIKLKKYEWENEIVKKILQNIN